ncbi:twin-arginine translocation signal domain-containing protein [Mobilicoccus massiliensis]|uniref:twin-arginine translocation signal domain-containing protein n=1 Tax=Mobilicoccus massiliensis TaxID=1522310 RepID=UPI0005917CB4|nr:twin-arginine translocation signal domain-containing protein [Mobilicoccus massiliensis]
MTDPRLPSRRDFMRTSALAAGAVALFSGCTGQSPAPATSTTSTTSARPTTPASPTGSPTLDNDSWAPNPTKVGKLSVTASQQGEQLLLHTLDGDRSFLAGVGLTAVLPGHLPEDFAPKAADYRRWLTMMGETGIRAVRLDSLQAPALYDELLAYNKAHPDAPLYLVQGVTIDALRAPVDKPAPLGSAVRRALSAEIADTSAAIHGDLSRASSATGPTGRWRSDVSRWVAAWVVGSPWDPRVVLATDRENKARPFSGTYFISTPQASATESWIAARMDELATHEAKRGSCAPIGAANHAATDPLSHPEEPVATDDQVGVDVNNIGARTAWPAGTFAAYRAMPYAPMFLRYQASYQTGDPYRAYLLDLRAHHQGMPLLITEFGVPASLGQSSTGANGRTEGFLSEQQAMRANADMLTMFREIGIAGGLLPSWTDDWSATSPPTEPRSRLVAPARRALFHDPLTSGQWFGLLAHDSALGGTKVVHEAPEDEMTKVAVDHDASYFYITFYFTRRVTSPVDVGFSLYDTSGLRLPGGSGDADYDVALRLVPTMSTVTMYVRRTLDPARLDGLPTLYLPRANLRGWVVEQLTLAPPMEVPGRRNAVPAEMQKVGELVMGTWDSASPAYTSLATWQLVRPDPALPMEWRLRLPWSMLTFADPAGRQGLVPDLGEPSLVPVTGMDVMIESSTPGSPANFHVDVPGWKSVPRTTERLKSGMDALRDALAATSRATP